MATKSTRAEIISMQAGERRTFSLDDVKLRTVYGYASEIGYTHRRVYMTKTNHDQRTITVSRVA